MADVFVGYARRDREKTLPIVRALESFGASVWWDTELIPGMDFLTELQGQLDAAKYILILWSQASVKSRWVRNEADYARKLGRLVQVVIEDVDLPIEFSGLSTVDLSNWRGDLRDKDFNLVLRQLNIVTSVANPVAEEKAAWAVAQSVNAIEPYQAFLSHHPTGAFADEAKRRLRLLSKGGGAENIFISYRREDSKAVARLIYEHLKHKINEDRIFFDVASIAPGQNFRDYIRERLIKCSTVLVVIGPMWLGTKAFGWPRIAASSDFVRIEVETALDMGLRVIPVLTEMSFLPKPRSLPPSLRRICDIQAASLDLGKSYDLDISLLTAAATGLIRGGNVQQPH